MAIQEREQLFKLLDGFQTGMLVTVDERSPQLHSRPMQVAQLEKDSGDVWLVSGKNSNKVHEIEHDDHVLLTFQDEHDRYVSLAGRAELVKDRRKVDEVWQKAFEVWFPGGKEDPNLVLIHVKAEDAEYWDNTGFNKIELTVESAKSLVTGQPPNTERPQQFGHVDLQ